MELIKSVNEFLKKNSDKLFYTLNQIKKPDFVMNLHFDSNLKLECAWQWDSILPKLQFIHKDFYENKYNCKKIMENISKEIGIMTLYYFLPCGVWIIGELVNVLLNVHLIKD